jgi:hypothetical protein
LLVVLAETEVGMPLPTNSLHGTMTSKRGSRHVDAEKGTAVGGVGFVVSILVGTLFYYFTIKDRQPPSGK